MRETNLPPFSKSVIAALYASRHESPMQRRMARQSIKDARLWVRTFGRRP